MLAEGEAAAAAAAVVGADLVGLQSLHIVVVLMVVKEAVKRPVRTVFAAVMWESPSEWSETEHHSIIIVHHYSLTGQTLTTLTYLLKHQREIINAFT